MPPIIAAAVAPQAQNAQEVMNPPGSGPFTTVLFVLIALLALVVILALAAGIRRARTRRASERRGKEEAAEAGVPSATPPPASAALRSEPPGARSLDRSATGLAPMPPVNDDFLRPTPVAPSPPSEPVADETPPASPLADERVAAAAPMDASPATAAEPEAAPASSGIASSPADAPVTQLKGVGPKVATRLAEMGVTTVGQIAALDADQAQDLDARLGPFAGRLHRDRWVEQARFLAAGDQAGFEAVFGKL